MAPEELREAHAFAYGRVVHAHEWKGGRANSWKFGILGGACDRVWGCARYLGSAGQVGPLRYAHRLTQTCPAGENRAGSEGWG